MKSIWTYQENLELNIGLTAILNGSEDIFHEGDNKDLNKLSKQLENATAEIDASQKSHLIVTCKSIVEIIDSNSNSKSE